MQYLAITLLGTNQPGLINEICKLASHCNCNLLDSRFAILGREFSANLLLVGTWNAIAKLEGSLAVIEKKYELRCLSRRTELKESQIDKLPYTAYVIAPDKAGTLHKLTHFFHEQSIEIHELLINNYHAPFTKLPMCSLTLSFTVPLDKPIADLREAFLVFCDEHNFDSIMEPQKN